jgi:hypothetical protein
MRSSANSTARKLSALIQKHGPSPAHASRIPAAAGPITRAVLNAAELSAIALDRSSRTTAVRSPSAIRPPTSSTRND